MRITKNADVRKNEILDIAQTLFNEKGYTQTTIDDILKESGIAKGTLYYHFKNKEDILLAMIDRQIEQREQAISQIAEDDMFSAVEKLVQVIQLLSRNEMMADSVYEPGNAKLHHESFTRSLMRFTPIMTEIVKQGIRSREFSTPYPQESVELLFCASELHDPRMFAWSEEERQQKKTAFFWMLELTLGISSDAKKRLYQLAGLSQEVLKNNG